MPAPPHISSLANDACISGHHSGTLLVGMIAAAAAPSLRLTSDGGSSCAGALYIIVAAGAGDEAALHPRPLVRKPLPASVLINEYQILMHVHMISFAMLKLRLLNAVLITEFLNHVIIKIGTKILHISNLLICFTFRAKPPPLWA